MNGTEVVCSEILSQGLCEAEDLCYFILTANQTGPCVEREIIASRVNSTTVSEPWCYKYFSFEVTVLLYFINCFTIGFGLIGLWYNVHFYDARSKVDKRTKKRYRNRMRGNQHTFIAWCSLFLVAGVLLTTSAMAYFIDPTYCYWVGTAYFYFASCLLCFAYFAAWGAKSWIVTLYTRRKQEKLDKKKIDAMFDKVLLTEKEGTNMRYI